MYKNKENLPGKGKNQQSCSYNLSPNTGNVCEVDVTKNMGPCIAESHYGYRNAQPCVFIKLNKVRIQRNINKKLKCKHTINSKVKSKKNRLTIEL